LPFCCPLLDKEAAFQRGLAGLRAPEELPREWLQGKLDDGTFDCVYRFLEGGGFAIANPISIDRPWT
jgi:hypothetical protein